MTTTRAMASSREVAMHRRSVIAALVGGCATTSGLAREVGHGRALGANISYLRRSGLSPTVVFESGLGDSLEVWADVIDRMAANVAYFAYSRPGYGESEAAPAQGSRSSEQATALLHDLLRVADVRPPYVLVGHSLGGLYIAHYASEFPNEVAGLVFVDGRPPGFRARCAEVGIQFCGSISSEMRQLNWPAHIVAELTGITASEDSVAAGLIALAGIPATIITSTRGWPGEQGAEAFAIWLEQQEALAGNFRSHRFMRAEGSGHYIQRERPALVARAIETVVAC